MIEQCSVCGQDCQAAGVGSQLPALARNEAGDVFCQVCAAVSVRALMDDGKPIWAYLSDDGKSITTWTGEPLARVTHSSHSRTGFYGSSMVAWRAVTPSGAQLYGRCGGPCMATKVRYAKILVGA